MSLFPDTMPVANLAAAALGIPQMLGVAPAANGALKSAQQRPEYQQARPPVNPRFAGPPGGMAQQQQGTPVTSPGALSPDTLQSPVVQGLLAHFGVSPDVNLDPNLFMHDGSFNTSHPLISRMLEGALSGAAFTHGASTPGEGISNVAQGMLASHAAHIQNINNQLMAPLMQANSVAALQDQVGKQSLQAAQMEYDQKRGNYYDEMYSNRGQLQQEREQHAQAMQTMKDQMTAALADPMKKQFDDFRTARITALAKQAKVDPATYQPSDKDILQMQNDWYANNSLGRGAASLTKDAADNQQKDVDNQRTTDASRYGADQAKAGKLGAAGITHGGKAATLPAGAKATDKDLDKQYRQMEPVATLIDQIQKGLRSFHDPQLPAFDDQGNAVTSTSQLEGWKHRIYGQLAGIHNQRAKLYAAYGMKYGVPDDPAAPSAAAPAAAGPKIDGRYNPATGRIE